MLTMGVRKLSVSLPDDLARDAAELARKEGIPLSAWLSRAAAHRIRIERGLAAVRDWEAEHGEFTAEELAESQAFFEEALARAGVTQR